MSQPINAILALWALGHSSGEIVRLLDVGLWLVHVTIERARQLGDPRAVIHIGRNGAPIGRPDKARRVLIEHPDTELVPLIPAPFCRPHGHLKSPENTTAKGGCRLCEEMTYKTARRVRKPA